MDAKIPKQAFSFTPEEIAKSKAETFQRISGNKEVVEALKKLSTK